MLKVPQTIRLLFLSLFIMNASLASAQVWNKVTSAFNKNTELTLNTDEITAIKNDILFLCSPASNGRKAGSKGEEHAGIYLEKRMNSLGLKPLQSNSYRQHFKFESDKKLSKDYTFTVGKNYLFIPEDVVPMAFSNFDQHEENFIMPLSEEPNAPWVIPIYNDAKDAKNPEYDWEETAYIKALKAQKKGASAVVLYDEYGAVNKPYFKQASSFDPLNIPVFIVHKHAYEKHIKNIKTITPIAMQISFVADKLIGTNIVGQLDNDAAQTIVIGAHYDHLGDNKLAGRPNAYFPGADQNASGVASMLALASRIQRSPELKKFNYIFVAFSAFENGMTGAKAFINNLKADTQKIVCMISLDRVGNLKLNKKFAIEGMGSSRAWTELVQDITLPSGIYVNQYKRFNQNSEHIEFYMHNIPSILVTTGKNDVHDTMNDFPNKLNYEGMTQINNIVLQLLQKINTQNTVFNFQKIKFNDANDNASAHNP